MTYNLEDFEKRDIYKSLIYKLCDFLIERRQNPKHIDLGLTRPVTVPLKEMGGLLEYTHSISKKAKIKELGKVLKHLDKDYIKIDDKNTIINILNKKYYKNFVDKYNNNETIKISCSVKKLEEYKKELREMTRRDNITKKSITVEEKMEISKKIKNKYKDIKLKYKDGKGYLKINKTGSWMYLGGYNTRTFKLTKYILDPTSKSKKVCDVYEQIRIRKDRKNKDLERETNRTYTEQKKAIRNGASDLQKKEFLRGYVTTPKFDDPEKKVIITFK